MTDKNQKGTSVSLGGEVVLYPSKGNIDPEFSKRITALRFALAVLVVFIHNGINKAIHFADGDVIIEMPLWIQIIHDTMSHYWGGIAVPTFFIISSYLFFAKPKPTIKTVQSKLKGIVLPYILWTALAILLFFVAQSFEFSKPYFAQPENIVRNWDIGDYFKALLTWDTAADADTALHTPFVAPFWYVRDLIIVMLLSPIIKFFAGKFPAAWLILVTALNVAEMLHITNIQYGFTNALFYFSLGFYAVKHIGKVMDFLDSIKWRDFIAAYGFSFVLTVYARMNQLTGSGFVSWFNLLFTIGLAIKIAGVVSKKEKIYAKLSHLSGFSFWIFAAHLPFVLPVMRKLIVKIIPMHGVWILVYFFGVVILCVGLLLIFGIALKRLLPKVFAMFNGGR